jgi:hypothetical protein
MSLYLLGLLVILGRFWCPEEDVVLSKLSSKNRVLRGEQLSKVVPKAVLIVLAGFRYI